MYKIYLAGGMSGLSYEESNQWRIEIAKRFEIYDDNIVCINPNTYYNFEEPYHLTETEVRNFDLHKLKNCDLVIVNFNAPNSIGTAQELALAKEWGIPVIGFAEESAQIHPWLNICVERIFTDWILLTEYVRFYYVE